MVRAMKQRPLVSLHTRPWHPSQGARPTPEAGLGLVARIGVATAHTGNPRSSVVHDRTAGVDDSNSVEAQDEVGHRLVELTEALLPAFRVVRGSDHSPWSS